MLDLGAKVREFQQVARNKILSSRCLIPTLARLFSLVTHIKHIWNYIFHALN